MGEKSSSAIPLDLSRSAISIYMQDIRRGFRMV